MHFHLLGYSVRDRPSVSLEAAIEMITSRPAAIWRLHDRGRLVPGFAADVTVFDPRTVGPRMPELDFDLPGGTHRLEQKADGFRTTIVNGTVLTNEGEPTETRPGRLLRASAVPRRQAKPESGQRWFIDTASRESRQGP